MSLNCTFAFKMYSVEDVSGVDGASLPFLIYDQFDKTGVLNGSSTPPITKIINKIITLSGGAYTIDLTTETGAYNVAQNGTGLKVRMIRVEPLGANNIVLATGAANGYAIQPTAKTVYANGGIWMEQFGFGLPTIGPTAKNIDVTGTLAQQFRLSLLMG